ncbi:MAG TPA: type II toxin-antitoxin system RelE/ParE family toxin [Mycobacteriales bacterium]|nr:type II toxin-antitoxin system RelE/ParE family toxin [Mycobacteriales bacterium]
MTWSPTAQRDLLRLPEKIVTAVAEFVYGPLADSPHRVGRPLHLELAGRHAARRGSYRVVYRIDDDQRRVRVESIDHRSDVYRRR